MTDPVTFVLLGAPVPWARAAGGRTRGLFTPTKQRNNAATLHIAAENAMDDRQLFDEPVKLTLLAEITIPSSWSNKKQRAALLGEIRPGSRPDLSNIIKQVEDACNGIVYRDDSLIVEIAARKIYGNQPKLVITVAPIEPMRQASAIVPAQHRPAKPTVNQTISVLSAR